MSGHQVEQQCVDTPGIPPNPMPFWSHFPLLNKLPVPSTAPAGTIILYNGHMGHTVSLLINIHLRNNWHRLV